MMEFFEDARNFVSSFFEPDINGMKAKGDATGLVRVLFSEKYGGKASEALEKMGAAAVEPLVAALRSKGSSQSRSRAAQLLGTLKDARALKPLLGALNDFDWKVRRRAAEALGKLKDEQAIAPLIKALRDPEWRVRANAAEALGKFSDSRVVPALEAACKDVYYIVRYTAVEALGQVGTKSSIDVVRAALKDPDSVARNKAVWALGRIGTEDMLLEVLKDADPILRGAACYTLARLHPATALEPLLAAIKDPDAGVRYYAVAGIAEIGDKPARNALAELASSSSDDKVRKEARDRMSSKGWVIPVGKTEPPRHLHYGGLGEPTCSDDCYQKAAAYALLDIGSGKCGICGKKVRAIAGQRDYAVIPYESGTLVVCQSCAPDMREKMKTYRKCSICQRAL